MARRKLPRFQHNAESENVVERGKEIYTTIKGKWKEKYFKNLNPIVLELACGKGEYTTGLAKEFPNKNFIGIDINKDYTNLSISRLEKVTSYNSERINPKNKFVISREEIMEKRKRKRENETRLNNK